MNGGKLKSVGDSISAGGSIDLRLAGTFWMKGTGARVDVSGNGGGGAVTVTTAVVALESGVVSADGGTGSSCGDGGTIDVTAAGSISVEASVHSTTSGGECYGGSIILSGGSVVIAGDLDARGGAGASEDAIGAYASTGDIEVASSGALRADGIGQPFGIGADGGEISLVADEGSIAVAGTSITLTGKSPEGSGGVLYMVAAEDILMSARITASSGTQGIGGDLYLDAVGDLIVDGDVLATGGSGVAGGAGGDIELHAGNELEVASLIDSSAATGGLVIADALGPVTISGSLVARGNRQDAGLVWLRGCAVEVAGTIDARSLNGGAAGAIGVAGGIVHLLPAANVRRSMLDGELHRSADRGYDADDRRWLYGLSRADHRCRRVPSALLNARMRLRSRGAMPS